MLASSRKIWRARPPGQPSAGGRPWGRDRRRHPSRPWDRRLAGDVGRKRMAVRRRPTGRACERPARPSY